MMPQSQVISTTYGNGGTNSTLSPKYGYYANANKTWLVTKKDFLPKAEAAFEDAGVWITSEGRPYLGVPLGTDEYIQSFVADKVNQWSRLLATIAHAQPQCCLHSLHPRDDERLIIPISYLEGYFIQPPTPGAIN